MNGYVTRRDELLYEFPKFVVSYLERGVKLSDITYEDFKHDLPDFPVAVTTFYTYKRHIRSNDVAPPLLTEKQRKKYKGLLSRACSTEEVNRMSGRYKKESIAIERDAGKRWSKPIKRTLYPVCGLKILSPRSSSTSKVPLLGFLVPAANKEGAYYVHTVPMILQNKNSEFQRIWFSVFGSFCKKSKKGVKDTVDTLTECLRRKQAGFSVVITTEKYRVKGSGKEKVGYRWNQIELVSMGESHPGRMKWPEDKFHGEDFFDRHKVQQDAQFLKSTAGTRKLNMKQRVYKAVRENPDIELVPMLKMLDEGAGHRYVQGLLDEAKLALSLEEKFNNQNKVANSQIADTVDYKESVTAPSNVSVSKISELIGVVREKKPAPGSYLPIFSGELSVRSLLDLLRCLNNECGSSFNLMSPVGSPEKIVLASNAGIHSKQLTSTYEMALAISSVCKEGYSVVIISFPTEMIELRKKT